MMKFLIGLILFLVLADNSATAQHQHFGWEGKNIFQTDYFIENKGQFKSIDGSNFLFGVDNAFDHVFFSDNGFYWPVMINQTLIDSDWNDTGRDDFENEERDRMVITDTLLLRLQWLNANSSAAIICGEKSKHYFSYGDADKISYGYKTITYKNLYDGIDVVYSIPENGGIEYSIIVHPNADLSKVKMFYSADKPLQLSVKNNELFFNNEVLPFSEKNLKAFDENGKPVTVTYSVNENVVSFVTSNYNAANGLTIDPWVSPTSSLTGTANYNGVGSDVDYDLAGDLFVFGGGGSTGLPNLPKVAKYDANGNLLWTFNGNVSSIGWTTSNSAAQLGGFVVDKSSGKSYISQGYTNGGNRVVRLTTGGVYDNFVSVANNSFQEIWEMKFNCVTGDLLGMGGGTNSALNFGVIDTTTGNVNTLNVTGITTSYFQDIVNSTINDNGEPFIVFASGSTAFVNNRIYKLNNNYSSSLWSSPTGFNVLDEANNKSFINNSFAGNGFNCLAVNAHYLFYYDGHNLKAFNPNTGAVIGNPLTLINQSQKLEGGIYVNTCDEVFIGGVNGDVMKYYFDGTNFNALPSLTIPAYAGLHVFDLAFNPLNSLIYVSGQGFVATLDPQTLCVDSISSIQMTLNTICPDSMWVQIQNPNSTSSYSFVWRDSSGNIISNTIQPAGVSGNGLGNLTGAIPYSVQVLQTSACQVVSSTVNFTLNCVGQFVHLCYGQSFQLPGGSIVDSSGIYHDTIPSSVPGIDSIIVTNLQIYPLDTNSVYINLCSGQSYTLPSGQVVNSNGTWIDSLTNIHNCDSIITTHVHVSVLFTNQNVSVCIGNTYTLPGGTVTNQPGIYTDTLITAFGCDSIIKTHLTFYQASGAQQVSICNGDSFTLPGGGVATIAGVYVDTISSPQGCDSVVTTTLTLRYPTFSSNDTAICLGTTILLPDGQQVSNAGTYTSIISNFVGCDSTITTNLTTVPPPFASLGTDTAICEGLSWMLNGFYPGATYQWSNGSTDSSIVVTTTNNYSVSILLPPCPAVIESVTITFKPCSCLIMPNAFSPNNDGDNDAVKPLSDCNGDINPYEYCIYNRWGELLFKTNDFSERWDGTYKGVDAEVGVYIYTVSFFNPIKLETVFLKGNITLLR